MRALYSARLFGSDGKVLRGYVAANLGFYLAERRLTQKEFAKRVGVSEPTVSRWLEGEILPKDQYWPKILQALGLESLDELTKNPARPAAKKKTIPEKDRDPILRFLRMQANELGFDLHVIESRKS